MSKQTDVSNGRNEIEKTLNSVYLSLSILAILLGIHNEISRLQVFVKFYS